MGFLSRQNRGGDITTHDIQYTGRQGTIRIVAFYVALEKVGLDGQPFPVFAFSYGGYLQIVQEVLCFRSCEQQAVNVDFTVHLVNGAIGEVCLDFD